MEKKDELQRSVDALKAQGYNSICFWLPAYNVGGGTWYFCQLAMYLKEHTDLNVYYMDYKGGYPSGLLEDTDVTVLEYRDEDEEFVLKEKCVIVTNSTRAIQMKKMRADNKMLFWHYETFPCAWHAVFIMNETRDFLKLCLKENAMVFHDWSGKDIIEQDCGAEFPPAYLPLFLPPKPETAPRKLIRDNEIHVLWVGRLAAEKIQSVYNIITNFAAYQTDKRKVMHIIGDSNFRKQVEQFAQKYADKIDFVFTGTIPKDKLNQYMIENADITFCMGLSALEGAALNIPSAVVKLDTKSIKGDEFWWLFDTKEYCAGILPSQRNRFNIRYSRFKDMLDDICENGMKEELGARCYQYFMENMASYDDVVIGFLNSLHKSSLTMDKLEKCIKYVPYNHLRVIKRRFLLWELPPKIIFKGWRE